MRLNGLAAVVFDLNVLLGSALGRVRVRSRIKPVAQGIERNASTAEQQTAPLGQISNLILEFQERKTDGVSEGAGIKVNPRNVRSGNVFVDVFREAKPERARQRVGKVVEAVEQAGVVT